MKPYRGQIVDFNHAPNAKDSQSFSPAIIKSVSDKGVNLTAFFLHGTREYFDVQQGDLAGQWNFSTAQDSEKKSK